MVKQRYKVTGVCDSFLKEFRAASENDIGGNLTDQQLSSVLFRFMTAWNEFQEDLGFAPRYIRKTLMKAWKNWDSSHCSSMFYQNPFTVEGIDGESDEDDEE